MIPGAQRGSSSGRASQVGQHLVTERFDETTLHSGAGRRREAPRRIDVRAPDEIVPLAVAALRRQYSREIDPAGFQRGPFTILQMRILYQAVYGHALMKDTFRRIVAPHLVATGVLAHDFG